MAITCMLPSATRHHRSHTLPSAMWCPRAIPVTRVSPSTARHHRSHITVGRMVPPSSARHPHIAIACASPFTSPSATWCPRAMPITRMSPSLTRHCQLHGAPEQCLSPACHRCLRVTVRVTIGRTVPMSNACHPHVAVACASPFASLSAAQCPRATPVTCTSPSPWMCCCCTQLEDAQSTIPKYDVIFMVFEEGNKRRMFLYVPSTVLVS